MKNTNPNKKENSNKQNNANLKMHEKNQQDVDDLKLSDEVTLSKQPEEDGEDF